MVLHRPVELAGVIGMWPKQRKAKKPASSTRSLWELCYVRGKLDHYRKFRALSGVKLRQSFRAGGQRRFFLAECEAYLARAHCRVVVKARTGNDGDSNLLHKIFRKRHIVRKVEA